MVNLAFEIGNQGPAHTWVQIPFSEIWWSKNWAPAQHWRSAPSRVSGGRAVPLDHGPPGRCYRPSLARARHTADGWSVPGWASSPKLAVQLPSRTVSKSPRSTICIRLSLSPHTFPGTSPTSSSLDGHRELVLGICLCSLEAFCSFLLQIILLHKGPTHSYHLSAKMGLE